MGDEAKPINVGPTDADWHDPAFRKGWTEAAQEHGYYNGLLRAAEIADMLKRQDGLSAEHRVGMEAVAAAIRKEADGA